MSEVHCGVSAGDCIDEKFARAWADDTIPSIAGGVVLTDGSGSLYSYDNAACLFLFSI